MQVTEAALLSTKEPLRVVNITENRVGQCLKNFARNVEIIFLAHTVGAFRKSSGEHFHTLKMYRGHECEWRGWLTADTKDVAPPAKQFFPLTLSLLVALLITLLAIYFIGS
jgi:hypothetical protein